jgi:phage tail-like protein
MAIITKTGAGFLQSPIEDQLRSNFIVEIDDINSSRATAAGPIGADIALVEVREGGSPQRRLSRGSVTQKAATITRALDLNDLSWYDWWKQTERGEQGYQRTITVTLLKQDHSTGISYNLENCVMSEYEGFNGDATAITEATMERMVINPENTEIIGQIASAIAGIL